VITRTDLSGSDKILLAVDKAARDLGYEFSHSEKLYTPMIYSDKNDNKIIFNQYTCSDSDRIKNGEVSFYTDVFDPYAADSTQEIIVSGSKALLCEKDSRSYLIWYPNGNTILMLDYEPDSVSYSEIMKMAESCQKGGEQNGK